MLSKITFTPAVGSAVDLHASTGSYQVSRTEGIVGPPDPREVNRIAPGRDGSLDDTRFINERRITLEGEILGSSQSDVWTKWDALAAAFQSTLLSKGTLKITLPDGTTERQASVVLTGAAQPSFEGGNNYLQYQVNFRAPDPRWYGTTLNTQAKSISGGTGSTSGTITNAGNAPTSPKFTFGGSDSISIVRVTVPTAYASLSPQGENIDLIAGSSGVFSVDANSYIDCLTRTAKFASGGMSATTEWPVLYPGSSTWSWGSASVAGTHTTTISWYDAWW